MSHQHYNWYTLSIARNFSNYMFKRQSQWPRGLRCGSTAARLLRLWVRIPPGAFVCCECCVLSGKGLYVELITRPEESHRLWCIAMCDIGTTRMRRPWPALGRSATGQKKVEYSWFILHTTLTKHSSPGLNKFLKYLNYKNKRIRNPPPPEKKRIGWRRAARHYMLTRQAVTEIEGLAV